MISVVQSVIVC